MIKRSRPTWAEVEKMAQANRRLEKEHDQLNNYTLNFFRQWAELDNAMGALLYELLHIQPRSSRLAYAIYFSPTSAEARSDIVSNVIAQFVQENADHGKGELKELEAHWLTIKRTLRKTRIFRNKIAHGSPIRIAMGNRTHIRLMSPAFDVIRVGSALKKRQIPGITAKDVEKALNQIIKQIILVDDVNRLIVAFHAGENDALPEMFLELEGHLKALEQIRIDANRDW